MRKDVYFEMIEVMRSRGGAYSGADIPEFYDMVEELFTPEEAAVNNAMPEDPFTAVQMAEIVRQDEKQTEQILEDMANKGLCAAVTMDGTVFYKSAAFMIGILEFQFMPGTFGEREKRLAELIYKYKDAMDKLEDWEDHLAGDNSEIRVITVDSMINPKNTVHTYDQVQRYIDETDLIAVVTCYCRHAAALRGKDLHGMPTETCMGFGLVAKFAIERMGGREISKKEAREILDKCEEAGLIHMSQNKAEGIEFICNCDRWHCVGTSKAIQLDKPCEIMSSGYQPQIEGEDCVACEDCLERCPSTALTLGDDDIPVVEPDRCFGCAVCATGCPTEAITMVPKADYTAPPQTGANLLV